MLRFIKKNPKVFIQCSWFQYIPCYGLSGYGRLTDKAQEHFNTSHVTVYQKCSYHCQFLIGHFNTSHVTVYHAFHTRSPQVNLYFNTSHVTVYRIQKFYICRGNRISIHPMLRFIMFRLMLRLMLRHFNTSHVTVYHQHQNHSTYQTDHFNTSHVTVYQYQFARNWFTINHFNTSHVTVYPRLSARMQRICTNFNTSHVTVYHSINKSFCKLVGISIHPMLRFIRSDTL